MKFKEFREQMTEAPQAGAADPMYLRKLLRGVKINVSNREVPVSLSRVMRGISIFNRTGRMQSIPQNIMPHYDAYLKKQTAVSSKFANRAPQIEETQVDQVIQEKVDDPPPMLVLKRAGIRIFSDGRRVALYTDSKLGLTFSIPYDENFGTATIPGVQPK